MDRDIFRQIRIQRRDKLRSSQHIPRGDGYLGAADERDLSVWKLADTNFGAAEIGDDGQRHGKLRGDRARMLITLPVTRMIAVRHIQTDDVCTRQDQSPDDGWIAGSGA